MTADVTSPVALVREYDIAEGIWGIESSQPGIQALVLVRLFGEPIGTLTLRLPGGGIGAGDLARSIVAAFTDELRVRFGDCGLAWDGELPTEGVVPSRVPSFVASRERVLSEGPEMTVAICTHNRPETLEHALRGVCGQRYQRLRILVIDNAPSDDRTRGLVASFACDHDIEYAVEPRPGLSWARNRAIQLARTEIIAWADDDDVCDEWWAAEIARGFVEVPEADAVTGTMIPTELETPSQMFFEQYGSVRQQRGFRRAVFSTASRHRQSPLYPLPPFGIGANMAFRRAALERIGGFDCALGAGTLTRTGEDTAALSALLLAAGTVVYQPTAIVRHANRRDSAVLRDHLRGHGRGLGAFYTSMLVRHPSAIAELVRLSPQALRDQFSAKGRRLSKLDDQFPRELLRANRIGLLQGPLMYAVARHRARRLRRMVTT